MKQDLKLHDILIYMAYVTLIVLAMALVFTGCQTPQPMGEGIWRAVDTAEDRIALYWENTTEPHPERKVWSDTVIQVLEDEAESFSKAKDMTFYCPKYKSLSRRDQLKAWGELVVGITYYESAFKPTSRMIEKQLSGVKNPVDPITKRPVASEGLLQLSYQDKLWAPYCEFDWLKDKSLSDKDPRKTIFDPIKNLECGLKILARQIQNHGAINMSKNVYWAVLRTNGKYSKIPEIQARVKKHASKCY